MGPQNKEQEGSEDRLFLTFEAVCMLDWGEGQLSGNCLLPPTAYTKPAPDHALRVQHESTG